MLGWRLDLIAGAMCGIAGIFRFTSRPAAPDVAAVVRMMDAQRHRGPDDWGLLVPDALAGDPAVRSVAETRGPDHLRTYRDPGSGPGVILGARRLSIIDLSTRARMPMGSGDGRLWVAHNGEIYNHRELRAELGGDPFRSAGDTEAILRSYAAWGVEAPERLRGMFAFALFETAPRPRLLLARDRLGIKPLYHYRDRERLVFASEVRALLRSGVIPDEASDDALIRFLQLGSVPAPHTTVRDVVSLGAGRCLVADAGGTTVRRYWDPGRRWRPDPGSPARAPGADAVARTRALLDESLALHLSSDVPLGVFLSGGTDSAGLVALASGPGRAPLTTLSLVFDAPGHGEGRHARLVAERYRTDHREIVLGAAEFFARVPGALGALDEPTVDGINTYFVAGAARRAGLTVVLSGTGGDEVFLGYGHFRRAAALERVRRLLAGLPGPARRSAVRAAVAAGAAAGRPGVEKLEYLAEPSPENVYLAARGLFSPRQLQALLGIGAAEIRARGPVFADPAGAAPAGVPDAFARLEFAHYLENQLLKDTDVMSMAHSVEARVPYLDHHLVEYVAGVPAAVKLGGRRPKPLLIGALGDALPRAVWDRPKMGFTLPFDRWMRQRADELEAQSLEPKRLDRGAVEAVWRGFAARRVHWSRPWALVVLAALDAARRRSVAQA